MTRDKKIELYEIACANNLTMKEITKGYNDYPKGLGTCAIIGFETFEEAEEFAKNHKGEIGQFKIRDGHGFLVYKGHATEPYNVHDYLRKLGDDYYLVTNNVKQYTEEVLQRCSEADNLDDAKDILDKAIDIREEIVNRHEGQSVIIYKGRYFETVDSEFMSFHEDVYTFYVGVYFE